MGMAVTMDADDSILPLLRERRAELSKGEPDYDRCFAMNAAWLEKLRRQLGFARRIVEGADLLASLREHNDASPSEPTGPMLNDAEPCD